MRFLALSMGRGISIWLNSWICLNILSKYLWLLLKVQPPLRYAIMSARSLGLASPANAMALPGANPDGDLSHLSRLPSVHLTVALVYRAFEYAYPSEAAMF